MLCISACMRSIHADVNRDNETVINFNIKMGMYFC